MGQRDTAKIDLRVAGEPVVAESTSTDDEFRFPELLLVFAKRKSFIIRFVFAALVLAVLGSLFLHNTYTAETKVMPPQQNQPMSTTAMLSQLGPLAALAGQSLGLRTPSDLYVSILRSQTIADAIVDRFSLMSVYNKKRRVDARKELEKNTLIVAGKDGVISVSVEDSQSYLFSGTRSSDASKQRAADIANAYVDELEKLTRTLAMTEAAKRRAFFERETKMAMDDLASAEQSLKETQEKTGLILLEPQSRAMIDALTSLRAKVAAQQVVVQSMQAFATPENPDLMRAQQELSALREQVAHLERGQSRASIADLPVENVPTAGLEYVRKLREVKYREALFELLAKQYEAAKIDEARDAVIVQQLDKATKPEKKSSPLRAVLVVCSTMLALLAGGLATYLMEKVERAKETSQFASQLQLFMFYLGRRKA